jgi:predicted CXXCH cytochrome family protein
VKRLAILAIGGAVWLLLAAIPVLADGGPHVMSYNNGSTGIKADGCASCHRIHTSTSPTGFLLTSSESTITEFCRSCHGATGTGASTDVDTGIQYGLSGIARDTGTPVGALRSGGFISARIGSGSAYRLVTAGSTSASNPRVPVAAAALPVTSAHLNIGGVGGNGLTAPNIVWGNGILGTPGAGPTLANEMECTACHNPHGNGNYRILNGIPNAGAPQPNAASAVNVTDATFDPARTRNYTVIQIAGTPGVESTFLLYADQVLGTYSPLSGDYFHKNVPYTGSTNYDGPNARPNTSASSGAWNSADPLGFNVQMTNWCAQCHTRYMAASGSRTTYSGDAIYAYRHTTAKNRTCTTCHVAHGTNAVMNQNPALGTTYSANVPWPGANGTTVGDSRLLKVDNRGTCQLCHDPTSGSAATAASVLTLGQGPVPVLIP